MDCIKSTSREKARDVKLQSARLFVGNIPYNATEAELASKCEVFGPVLSFKLVMDNSTGIHRGYGFCQFCDEETALSALRNQKGLLCRGRQLRLDRPTIRTPSHCKAVNLAQKPPILKDPPQSLRSTSSLHLSTAAQCSSTSKWKSTFVDLPQCSTSSLPLTLAPGKDTCSQIEGTFAISEPVNVTTANFDLAQDYIMKIEPSKRVAASTTAVFGLDLSQVHGVCAVREDQCSTSSLIPTSGKTPYSSQMREVVMAPTGPDFSEVPYSTSSLHVPSTLIETPNQEISQVHHAGTPIETGGPTRIIMKDSYSDRNFGDMINGAAAEDNDIEPQDVNMLNEATIKNKDINLEGYSLEELKMEEEPCHSFFTSTPDILEKYDSLHVNYPLCDDDEDDNDDSVFYDLDEPVGFDLASLAADAATVHDDFHMCTEISTDLIYKISCLSKKNLFLQLSFLQESMSNDVDPIEEFYKSFPDVAQLMFLLETIAASIRRSLPADMLSNHCAHAKHQEPQLKDDNHMQGDNGEKQPHFKEEAAQQLSDAQQYLDAIVQTAPAYALTVPYLLQAQQYHKQQQAILQTPPAQTVHVPLSSCSPQAAELYHGQQPMITQTASTQVATTPSWSMQAQQYQDHQQIMKQISSSQAVAPRMHQELVPYTNSNLPPHDLRPNAVGLLHQQAFLPHQPSNGYMPHQQLPAVPSNQLSPAQLLQLYGHHPSPHQQQTNMMPYQYSGCHEPTAILHMSHQQPAQPQHSEMTLPNQQLPAHCHPSHQQPVFHSGFGAHR